MAEAIYRVMFFVGLALMLAFPPSAHTPLRELGIILWAISCGIGIGLGIARQRERSRSVTSNGGGEENER